MCIMYTTDEVMSDGIHVAVGEVFFRLTGAIAGGSLPNTFPLFHARTNIDL